MTMIFDSGFPAAARATAGAWKPLSDDQSLLTLAFERVFAPAVLRVRVGEIAIA